MATKVPVTMRAVIQRLNRTLAKEDKKLVKARGWNAKLNLGDYFMMRIEQGVVCSKHVDPAALAQKLEVLKPYETIKE